MREINKIIVHCSDSNVKSHDNIETIRGWHVKERGYSDIGYHYVITQDGVIHEGRPLSIAGAHAYGHNTGSIGICLTGKSVFTQRQHVALSGLLFGLKQAFDIKPSNIIGHYDVSIKTCPNFDVPKIFNKSVISKNR